jgi:hypothetical protein
MIKLTEAQKVGSTMRDVSGRTIANSSIIYRDLFVNPEHIISINEEYSSEPSLKLARLETTRGSFVVVGSPIEIEKQLSTTSRRKSVLKD